MNKLKLDLESLTVDTFETVADDGETRGTVEAYGSPWSFTATSGGYGFCPDDCLPN
jgi:hypothetical protein